MYGERLPAKSHLGFPGGKYQRGDMGNKKLVVCRAAWKGCCPKAIRKMSVIKVVKEEGAKQVILYSGNKSVM